MRKGVINQIGFGAALAVTLGICSLAWAEATPPKCPTIGANPFVYGVGSSTMGTSLGKALETRLESTGARFQKWGKASSGLARPDFHDWPKAIGQVAKKKKPDVFVISLGTNDFQALYHKKKWIKIQKAEAWKEQYRRRIEESLEAASGRDRKRMVVWITPTIFNSRKAKKVGKWIRDLILEVSEDFGGPVYIVDAYAKTTKNGEPLEFFTAENGKKYRIFGEDNIHLTQRAVDSLMVEPVLRWVEHCRPSN